MDGVDGSNEEQFRFQDLEIWRRAARISPQLFALADELEKRHLFWFAEQLRGATLSITNNIAEGSGSVSDADFAQFLNMSRRSLLAVANMLLLLAQENLVDTKRVQTLLDDPEQQGRM